MDTAILVISIILIGIAIKNFNFYVNASHV